jgi:hypothetical protein
VLLDPALFIYELMKFQQDGYPVARKVFKTAQFEKGGAMPEVI